MAKLKRSFQLLLLLASIGWLMGALYSNTITCNPDEKVMFSANLSKGLTVSCVKKNITSHSHNLAQAIVSSKATTAVASRTVTIINNCDFQVNWALKGTPLKDRGSIVYCDANASFGDLCFNGQGFCGEKNGDGRQCYFKYPTLKSSYTKYDYMLGSKEQRIYGIDLVNLNNIDKAGNLIPISQYTLNIVPQSNCKVNTTSTPSPTISCSTATCSNIFNNTKSISGEVINGLPKNGFPEGACSPDRGNLGVFSQAEITFNDRQNDFYDISIINGANVPVSIKPDGSNYPLQNGRQNEFWCKTTGGLITGVPGYPKGCTWKFTPPDLSKNWIGAARPLKFIFRQVDNSSSTMRCSSDLDCTDRANPTCGLTNDQDYVQYKDIEKPGYCGKLLAFATMATISPLIAEVKNNPLAKILKLQNADGTINQVKYTSAGDMVTYNDMYQCKITSPSGYNLLDSCYNYQFNPNTTNDPDSVTQGSNAKIAAACCGCIDWPGVATDENDLCYTGNGNPPMCSPGQDPTTSNCTKDAITKIHHPNPIWVNTVKPVLGWLIDGCPDAYDYQFGDKHGTLQCTSTARAEDPGNNVNYTITFCPGGQGIADGGLIPPVSPSDCVGNWSNWSSCSKTCGGGTQTRSYTVTTPATNGGKACEATNGQTQSQQCNTQPCVTPTDCVGNWSNWSNCSKTCGGGTQTRSYTIITPSTNGGKACEATNGQVQTQQCNSQPCGNIVTVKPPSYDDAKKSVIRGITCYGLNSTIAVTSIPGGMWNINSTKCYVINYDNYVIMSGNLVSYPGTDLTATLVVPGWTCNKNTADGGKTLACTQN